MPFEGTAADGSPEEMVKYVLVLQDFTHDPTVTNAAFAVISTDRTGTAGARLFEVQLDQRDGLHHGSILDGRWIYTRNREEIDEDQFVTQLSEERMTEISIAIFDGLQLDT